MYPTVLASSVIRSSQQGESHGGVFLVNLETDEYKQVIDWNDQSISWEGRGWDRGLRGIDFYEDKLYLAASDEIFVYDKAFNIVKSFRNPYLKHCHEIHISNNRLYLTSTGFDSVLQFNLIDEVFELGLYIKKNQQLEPNKIDLVIFDPNTDQGPSASMNFHINNVYIDSGVMYVAGTKLNSLLAVVEERLTEYAKLPFTTHNAQPYHGGVLYNDTANDRIVRADRKGVVKEIFEIIQYEQDQLTWTHLTADRARQAFGRGLCVSTDNYIIAGSSPSTISLYEAGCKTPIKYIKLTDDIRNSIHGLEIWPFN